MSTEPTILRSSTGADFLASLPTLTGCTVRESILVVPFRGKRTMGVVRMDLPDADERPDRLGSVAIGSLSRLEGCNGVIFAVYTDATFPVAYARWEKLIAALDERFETAGFAVKDAFCVAADGWASWYEQAPAFDGHPLAEIDESPMAAQAAQARGGAPLPAHTDAGVLAAPDPAVTDRLMAMTEGLCAGLAQDAFGAWRDTNLPDAIPLIEQLLEHDDPEQIPLPMLAGLVVQSLRADRRDEMVLQIAFGRKVGEQARADSERLHALERETGLSMDEVVAADTAGGAATSELGALFVGDTTREPKIRRVHHGIAILRRTITHLDAEARPDLLCMLAWLCWASGSSTAAAQHAEAAIRIAPTHRMAATLLTLFDSGRIPDWIFAAHSRRPGETAPGRPSRRARRRAAKARRASV
ncbi:DUF4192 family protein [Microbacterium sp.]|uniref:DUF4192 family protein n=1 Tax=Microbacterium sp. TaxID=51671 RepID=UPI003A90DECB